MSNVISLRKEGGWLDDFIVEARDVAKVILAGLKSAGVRADFAKAWRGGKYPTTLDLAIDIDCPWSHVSNDGASFAKVRLLVDPHHGTLTVSKDEGRDAGCSVCSQKMIDCWLVTCRGHEDNGHPDHKPGWIDVDDFPDDTPDEVIDRIMKDGDSDPFWEARPDDSPMGHIFREMEKATREFIARYEVTHPEYVEKQVRRSWSGASEEFVRHKVAEQIERAKAVLSTGKKLIGSTEVEVEVEDWTPETVRAWLAENDISTDLTYREAWAKAKEIAGHPPKAMVEAGHRLRKGQ
ncbi:hypothetical protein [Nocardioides sp. LS1]|uniref:hypothetical protein n=1 Tax=Nocardioides sp. LS1 TaxID=1027620 RepID=UPI000F61D3CD|nr:hypothetical protein [Nocardioides sp. LS1]GCD88764.1 hypothetical protein NLS1_07700 [Nocardioides sp. LS1]